MQYIYVYRYTHAADLVNEIYCGGWLLRRLLKSIVAVKMATFDQFYPSKQELVKALK